MATRPEIIDAQSSMSQELQENINIDEDHIYIDRRSVHFHAFLQTTGCYKWSANSLSNFGESESLENLRRNYDRISMMLTMRFLLPLMLVLAVCWASIPLSDDVPPQPMEEVLENYRLPNDVVPTEYDIKLTPTLESTDNKKNFTFDGTSEITLTILKPTKTITFHAKELDIKENVELKYRENKEGNQTILKPKIIKDFQKDFVTLVFDTVIPKIENAKLSLHYSGKLNDKYRGFYKSSYQNKNEIKYLATTHFEPVSARQAFPCWDEPQLKARFSITITVPPIKNYKAISNMRGESKDGKTFIFDKTPLMSTYLVAFVVSDFENLQNDNKNFGVWAKPTVEEGAKKFALDYGWKALEELKNFTNIDYYGKEQEMTKLDQIAIPHFGTGAMENWGLVTYREPQLLYIEGKTTTQQKQSIATTIAHEFSHQWFGNLVTCEWWDYIWLNEGFATFFQYYISDKIIPKLYKDENWRFMEQFVVKNLQASSFVVDASSKTRALNPKTSVQTPTQIGSLFDKIAYKKGASIIYMMEGFLTKDVFQKGLGKYLNDYKSRTANSIQLFESIQNSDENKLKEYLPKDVKLTEVMKNWVNEPGYPVITVKWSKTPGTVNITQERFFLVKPVKEDQTQWYIPINYVTEDNPRDVMPTDKKSGWIIPGTHTLFNNLNNTKWILFNKNQIGYYRVNYEDSNWQLLATYLKTPNYVNISASNRAQLIDDALNLARTGQLGYKTALDITLYLFNETDYIPWYAAVRAFDYLDGVLQSAKNYRNYHKYVASKIKSFATEVNYTNPNGTHINKLAKVLALNTACRYEMKECENFVSKELKEWLGNKDEKKQDEKKEEAKKLSIDLRSGILCAGLRKANATTWNQTLEKYKTIEDENEKADILAGLGCASEEIVAQTFLALTLENDPVVDILAAMNSICTGNAKSFDILIKFINDNIQKIQEIDTNNSLIAFLNKLANKITTTDQYIELSLLVYGRLQVTQKVEGLTSAIHNLAWIKTYQKEVEEWILENCEVCKQTEPSSASAITLTSFLIIIPILLTRFY